MAFLFEKQATVMAVIKTSCSQPWKPNLSGDQIKARRVDDLEAAVSAFQVRTAGRSPLS
jgi:hypothetical protein